MRADMMLHRKKFCMVVLIKCRKDISRGSFMSDSFGHERGLSLWLVAFCAQEQIINNIRILST